MTTPLLKIRKQQGLTLQQLSTHLELDAGNLSRIERGKQIASTKLAEKISKLFNGQISEIEILYPERF
jgi:transcriptional regulator with XRE-family HTH domain